MLFLIALFFWKIFTEFDRLYERLVLGIHDSSLTLPKGSYRVVEAGRSRYKIIIQPTKKDKKKLTLYCPIFVKTAEIGDIIQRDKYGAVIVSQNKRVLVHA